MPLPSNLLSVAKQPRAFAVHELFFSTTDSRGRITSGNEVFVRISGYTTDELVGTAHNIIRHPDMPRAAFRLVWERLKAGQPVAAFVKNRAKDGCYYWVVALITPTPHGYLSVRFKPSGPLLGAAEGLYAQMLAAEQAAKAGGADQNSEMDAGARVLAEGLRQFKFADYEAFMWVMLSDELKHRDAAVARERRSMVQPLPADLAPGAIVRPEIRQLAEIYREGCRAYAQVNDLARQIDGFVTLTHTLDEKASYINRLTDELRISSMNVALASVKLGGQGLGLGVISRHVDETSVDVARSVHRLVAGITALSGRLRGVIFDLASARLQMEMGLIFQHELICGGSAAATWQERRGLILLLHQTYARTMGLTGRELRKLDGTIRPLSVMALDLEKFMMILHVSQVGAMVECARISSQGDFLDIFVNIREQIEKTHAELLMLGDTLQHLDQLTVEAPPIAGEIEQTAAKASANCRSRPTRPAPTRRRPVRVFLSRPRRHFSPSIRAPGGPI